MVTEICSMVPNLITESVEHTLQGTNISHLGKRNIIFKSVFFFFFGGYVSGEGIHYSVKHVGWGS